MNRQTYKPDAMDVCDMFDTTNKTIAQVAKHFHLTVQEVKDILMETEQTTHQ